MSVFCEHKYNFPYSHASNELYVCTYVHTCKAHYNNIMHNIMMMVRSRIAS